MKNNVYFILCLLVLTNFSCSSNDTNFIDSMWVDSKRVSCQGLDEQTCYRIQENDVINENDWQLFYSAIEGFDEIYEEGYIYLISLNRTEIKNPPQDGSSAAYRLVEIISKEKID